MITEGYRKRLADWVQAEKRRTGLSEAGLADTITRVSGIEVTRGSIQSWQSGTLKKGLSFKNLKALAAYRRESIEETQAWLNDDYELKLTKESEDVIEWMRCAPLHQVLSAIQVGINRVAKETANFSQATVLVEEGSDFFGFPSQSPVELPTSKLEEGDMFSLSLQEEWRLQKVLAASLKKSGLTRYQAATSVGMPPELVERVISISDSSKLRWTEVAFEAIASLCYEVEGWEGETPVLGNSTYRGRASDLRKVLRNGQAPAPTR